MPTQHCCHPGSCSGNILSKAFRGLVIGLAIKIPLSVVIHMIKKGSEEKTRTFIPNEDYFVSLLTHAKNRLKTFFNVTYWRQLFHASLDWDTMRFVLYFIVWLASFPAVLCFLRHVRSRKDQQSINHGIAGGISALSLFLDTPGARRSEIAVYLFSRMACAAWKIGVERKWLPSIPYGEIVMFCMVAGITQYTFVFEPDLMRKKFFQIIDELSKDPQGRLDKFLLNLRRQYHVRVPKGYEQIERSSCNTDFYYTGSLQPLDPEHHVADSYQPYMITGDSSYFDKIEAL